jgi:hypothetical protein
MNFENFRTKTIFLFVKEDFFLLKIWTSFKVKCQKLEVNPFEIQNGRVEQ